MENLYKFKVDELKQYLTRNHVDWKSIDSTGKNGRIIRKDLLKKAREVRSQLSNPSQKEITVYEDICPICLDDDFDLVLSCGHCIHKECCKRLNKAECCICRQPLTNLPEDISKCISQNQERTRQERQAEERNFPPIIDLEQFRFARGVHLTLEMIETSSGTIVPVFYIY